MRSCETCPCAEAPSDHPQPRVKPLLRMAASMSAWAIRRQWGLLGRVQPAKSPHAAQEHRSWPESVKSRPHTGAIAGLAAARIALSGSHSPNPIVESALLARGTPVAWRWTTSTILVGLSTSRLARVAVSWPARRTADRVAGVLSKATRMPWPAQVARLAVSR